MAVLIDTSILIAYARGRLDVAARVAQRESEEAFLSMISAGELLHGVQRAADPAIRARRLTFVEGALARFPVLDFDLATARTHAALRSSLAQKGQRIGVHDSRIAATCISRDLALVTANVRGFGRVPG